MPLRPLIAGNWKMFGLQASLAEIDALAAALHSLPPAANVAICPPATLVADAARRAAGTGILIGGQDCHTGVEGAHTGDVSAAMLVDAGASFVIVGHSERRKDHCESDALVRAKAEAALAAGLTPIVCVGETLDERKGGRAGEVVSGQLQGSVPEGSPETLVVAYEPVWAIGTGLTPSPGEIAEMHRIIRERLVARFGESGAAMRVLYGGSVKPSNAREILHIPGVNGALVGGASLKAGDFSAIVSALI